MLSDARLKPEILVDDARELRSFRITAGSGLGTKRGTGRDTFIDSVLTAVDGFYGQVLQTLRPWSARAPQLPKGGRTAAEEAGLEISPPPQDLIQDDSPPEPQPPVEVDVDLEVEQSLGVEPQPSDGGPLVSWTDAQDRLDHERDLALPQPE
jgi:hypothetical protein